ncbi:hypothetical protein NC653_034527 [Populus alba x Populus x berolinensis]|uniref:Uncharacterized protein n=1 Tax=Populus alba x Populus x berolinensis TaxID=444605 RepID=A0AAD6LMR0_9ROSI|nr:hypothetical protein NC653_034527 [Populus alba x Populus x berolinensis]
MVLDVAKSLAFPRPLLDLAHQQLSFAPKSLRITNGSKFDCLELREQVMYEYCAPGGDGDLLRPSPVHQLEPHSSAVDVMISHALQASIFC